MAVIYGICGIVKEKDKNCRKADRRKIFDFHFYPLLIKNSQADFIPRL